MSRYENWQSQLDDNTLLGSLSIPGTHNSAACRMALPSVQCQGASITDQLNNGVRFLDFRVGKYPLKSGDAANELTVCHGKFPIALPFPVKLTDALQELYAWQDQHKSEAVLVSIKDEGTVDFDFDNDEFAQLFTDNYLTPAGDRWYLQTQIPRLGDIRGKLVLFRRYRVKDQSREFGFAANSWPYNCKADDRGAFVVQDFCDVKDATMMPEKITAIRDLATNAQQHNSSATDGKLFVNYTSASNFFDRACWPEKIAEALSQDNLLSSLGKGSGIIVLDYAEANNWQLAHGLVDLNF